MTFASGRPSFSSRWIALHVVGDRRDLADVRRAPQLVLEPIDLRQDVGPLERVRRPLQHDLVAVDAGQLLVDDGRRLPSGWFRLKKLMWLVSTRSRKMPERQHQPRPPRTTAKTRRRMPRSTTAPPAAAAAAGIARAASRPVSGFTRLSSVGISTSEITKSTMIPTAEPMPNDANRDHVAGGQRQHAERGGRAGAEERRRQVRDGVLERRLAVSRAGAPRPSAA